MTIRRQHRSMSMRAAGVLACMAALAAPHAAIATAPAAPPMAFTVKDPAQLDAAAVARLEELRSKSGSWGWAELVDRGRIAVAQGDFAAAATAFEAASSAAAGDAERVMTAYCWASALIASAQSLPDVKGGPHPNRDRLLSQAGRLLNAAQRSVPQSRDIAAARLTAWSLLGDELETTAAEHQLRVIDPTLEGNPRCEPATIGLIVLIVFVAGRYALQVYDFKGYLEPEQRLALLAALDFGARLTGKLASGQPPIEVFTSEALR